MDDPKGEELAAVIAEIRQRVRAGIPNGVAQGHIPLPDLTPLLHARDAAEAKVASIGTVNPRPARAQEFDRSNAQAQHRARPRLARARTSGVQPRRDGVRASHHGKFERMQAGAVAAFGQARTCERDLELREEASELKDIRAHWAEWHAGWELKLADTEIQFLRAFPSCRRLFIIASPIRSAKVQHADFERSMALQNEEMQRRFWDELGRARLEYERMIHTELRLLRQRAVAALAARLEHVWAERAAGVCGVDWLKFADRFRGSEEDIRERQQMYATRFREHAPVLDLGCGRGEMIQVLQDAGITARGIDSNDDSIALCVAKGLNAEKADLFTYLSDLPDASLGGVICCQVVEHLPPARLPEMIRLVHAKLRAGGLVALETPNPECLAIFATHFYIDPTHRHPIPPVLTNFYLEEAGFGRIEIERLSPAIQSMPALAELPEAFRKEFFGSLDYAAFGIKLG